MWKFFCKTNFSGGLGSIWYRREQVCRSTGENKRIFDIGVVPSLSEGFSNTLLEFMAEGKPVVVTHVGGNSEAVLHDETGLIVSPGNAFALARGISSLLQNRNRALCLGNSRRERVEKMFTLEKMIEEYEKLFQRTGSPKNWNNSGREKREGFSN